MKGDISSFKKSVFKTCSDSLKNYRLEIELALGPAKITIRPVEVQKQEEQER